MDADGTGNDTPGPDDEDRPVLEDEAGVDAETDSEVDLEDTAAEDAVVPVLLPDTGTNVGPEGTGGADEGRLAHKPRLAIERKLWILRGLLSLTVASLSVDTRHITHWDEVLQRISGPPTLQRNQKQIPH